MTLCVGYNQNSDSMELGALVRISDCLFQNNSVESEPVGTSSDTDRSGFSDEMEALLRPQPIPVPSGGESDPSAGGGGGNKNDNKSPPGMSLQTESQRFDTRGQLFGDEILVGRGGGVAIIINADSAAEVEVTDCIFLENVAVEFGGGLYLLLRGPTSHMVEITQNR